MIEQQKWVSVIEQLPMADTSQCCNPFPCPYIGKDKTCEECNCYRDDYWNEDKGQAESEE